MHRLLASLLFLIALAGFGQEGERGLSKAVLSKSDADGRYFLLAIGINSYKDSKINLETAVKGAKDLQRVLTTDYTFDPADCRLLLDQQATRGGIIKALRELAQQTKESDSVLIYFAGHGNLDDITETGAWIPYDASFDTPELWLENSQIKAYLRAMKARHVLLVSDSCFAGDFFATSRSVRKRIDDAAARRAFSLRSRQGMTSGGVEPVMDGGQDGHSVYTWWLLTALRENKFTYVLPEQLHDRLKGAVAANARQRPKLGLLQCTGGELDGSFVFFRREGVAPNVGDNTASRPPVPDPEPEPQVELPAIHDAVASPVSGELFCILHMSSTLEILPDLHVYDVFKQKLTRKIKLPSPPSLVAEQGGKIIVYCPKAGVIDIIDPKTYKIIHAVMPEKADGSQVPIDELQTDFLGDSIVGYSRCAGQMHAINLKNGEVRKIGGGEYASGTSKYFMFQGNLGGSPSGQISVKTADTMKGVNLITKPHDTHSLVRLSGDGRFFTTTIDKKTHIHDSDSLKRVRSIVGHVVGFIPGTSMAVTLQEVDHNIDEIKEMNLSVHDLSNGQLVGDVKIEPPYPIWPAT